MTTAVLRVFGSRQGVATIPVVRVAGCTNDSADLSEILVCQNCGKVPTFDPDPSDPKVPVALQLFMVKSPDRNEVIFLGPQCLEKERARYASHAPVN